MSSRSKAEQNDVECRDSSCCLTASTSGVQGLHKNEYMCDKFFGVIICYKQAIAGLEINRSSVSTERFGADLLGIPHPHEYQD